MAYDKTTDLYDIQADVLTSDLSENPKISKLKQLKTESKVFTKALNATFEQLGNAQTSAAYAIQRVEAVENELAELKANGIGTGTGGGTQVVVDSTPVGRVVFDCVLRDGYVKANGATVGSASQDYPRLVEFVLNHPELLAADDEAYAANTALYVYNVTSDVMTLPNYIGRVMQGGNTVVSVDAGLPNITGAANAPYGWGQRGHSGALATYTTTTNSSAPGYPTSAPMTELNIDASRSNAIYGASTTVQPPAVMLIPQIRY